MVLVSCSFCMVSSLLAAGRVEYTDPARGAIADFSLAVGSQDVWPFLSGSAAGGYTVQVTVQLLGNFKFVSGREPVLISINQLKEPEQI